MAFHKFIRAIAEVTPSALFVGRETIGKIFLVESLFGEKNTVIFVNATSIGINGWLIWKDLLFVVVSQVYPTLNIFVSSMRICFVYLLLNMSLYLYQFSKFPVSVI